MIDRWIYSFFAKIDNIFLKVDQVLTFDFPKSKNKNVKSPDNRMDFPLE